MMMGKAYAVWQSRVHHPGFLAMPELGTYRSLASIRFLKSSLSSARLMALELGANQLDVKFGKDAVLGQLDGDVKGRLAAHRGQKRLRAALWR